MALRCWGWLVLPAILVEERRGIAPRPVVGLCGVSDEPAQDGFEACALGRLGERLLGVSLADLVREHRPEAVEICGGRAPFRGRRGIGRKGFRRRGYGGRTFRGKKVGAIV